MGEVEGGDAQTNLEPCPDCGQDVSPNAPTCPNCGAPIAGTPDRQAATPDIDPPPETRWGAGVLGGFLIFIFGSFNLSYLSEASTGGVVLLGFALLAGYWVSKSKFKAWPRVWLSCAVLSYLVPISAAIALGTGRMSTSGGAEALGAGLGVIALGFLAFFVGTIFAIVSYFTHKGANEKERKLEKSRA